MTFRVSAGTAAVIVRFEPAGQEYALAAGDHITVEFVAYRDGTTGSGGLVQHEPEEIVLCAPRGHRMRVWDSSGAAFDPEC
ncbi:hypothetical protein IU501_24105 [Nocardia otitidiscaviarum]|uniref:hypothetical protein n=1 Tax=Nocardia otitidiscaviarum TaxID=1823 RepID=UPI0004A75D8A|nr:hypothetical protein [Nocardia otitidiscaviarum]MBF6136078.1 hypothetical protein [Nocardia otitidiscaviarum]MBF6483862.1 hypothetical protein [Nocardia otitidiscaviarum]